MPDNFCARIICDQYSVYFRVVFADSAQTGLQTEKHNVFCCGRFGIFQQVFQTLPRPGAVHHDLLGQLMLNSSSHTRFCGVNDFH